MSYIHTLWSAPLQIGLSLVFLYLTMGPSIFAGFAIMVLMIPLNFGLVSCSKMVWVNQMAHKESRLKLINEVLNGIKVHVYAFQGPQPHPQVTHSYFNVTRGKMLGVAWGRGYI